MTGPELVKKMHFMRFLQDFRLFASVGFTIDRVTTQHTLKCVENSSDNKVP